MQISLLLASLSLSLVTCSPVRIRSPFAVRESHPVPRQWSLVGPAPADHIIHLQIGLKQSNFDELEQHLYEVSDPSHKRYGQHLTKSEVNNFVKPAEDTLDLVHAWLEDNGIRLSHLGYSEAKDWIKISLPVNAIEKLLDTQYSVFQHTDGEYLIRTPQWSLPLHLHEHISVIQPTNAFFRPRQMDRTFKEVFDLETASPPPNSTNPAVVATCDTSLVTPACLRTLYGTIDYVPQATNSNSVALNNFLGEINNRSDTSLFLTKYRPEAASAAQTFKIVSIADGTVFQGQENTTMLAAGTGLEGNLDSETILSIAWPTPLIAYSTGGSPPFEPDTQTKSNTNEPYLTWMNYMLSETDLPHVVSTSYADDEQTVPYSYAKSVCDGFAQLGARGISLFFGSGDSGVGPQGSCLTNDGKKTDTFLAMFPSSCPYITAVGATKNIPEVVATDSRNGFVSGGGFSRYFERPSYQNTAVQSYVNGLGTQFAGLYNSSGRAYPDLAAQGYHYPVIWNGSLHPLDGTSASTPTVAAIFALVNDALTAGGKSPMGFLNPWLYQVGMNSSAFVDVTSGSASGCGTTGFPATKGWDAVTGFGTPWFPGIREIIGA